MATKKRKANRSKAPGRMYGSPPKPMLQHLVADHGGHGLTYPTERAYLDDHAAGTEYEFETVLWSDIAESIDLREMWRAEELAKIARDATAGLISIMSRVLAKKAEGKS